MIKGIQYYPNDGTYWTTAKTIYAQVIAEPPIPCRKYHVSADIESAEIIAPVVLKYLRKNSVFHKVVKNRELLIRQSQGKQAGKFITLYMPSTEEQRNSIIVSLGNILSKLEKERNVKPSPNVPRSRNYQQVFIEQPLDPSMFIYGGFITDPRV
ncbi:MAG: hypothetical protein MI976_17610 [Pseudomonadales bacterium]|nr:hypothetical protein [Pseudomonadales bacterium]